MLKGDPYLHLFDLKAGVTKPIARHDSGWGVYKGQPPGHPPAPQLHPDEETVLFSCDKEPGEPALHLADVVRRLRETLAGPAAQQLPALCPARAAADEHAAEATPPAQHYLDGWQPGSNEGRAPDFHRRR